MIIVAMKINIPSKCSFNNFVNPTQRLINGRNNVNNTSFKHQQLQISTR